MRYLINSAKKEPLYLQEVQPEMHQVFPFTEPNTERMKNQLKYTVIEL